MIEIKTRPLRGVDELWEVFLWFQEYSYENVLREERYYVMAAPEGDNDDERNRISLRARWECIRDMMTHTSWSGKYHDDMTGRRWSGYFSDPATAAIFKLTWG